MVSTGGASGFWVVTGADSVDSGAATGWTIPGRGQEKSGTTYTDLSETHYFKIRVNGYAIDTPGTVTLSPTQTEMGIPITATLTDDDGGVTGTTWQWSSSDTAGGTFTDITGRRFGDVPAGGSGPAVST